MVVAIIKCPYCKAFIEEGSEFCSNCGTKLIFPEDEDIEEEIPGERIIELGEKEYEKSRSQDQPPEEDVPESGEMESYLEEEPTEKPEAVQTDSQDEVRKMDPDEPSEKRSEDDLGLKEETSEADEGEDGEKLFGPFAETPPPKGIPSMDDNPESGGITPSDEPPASPPETGDEQLSQKEATPKSGSWLFPEESLPIPEDDEETGELEDTAASADKEKEEIERFLDSLKKERQEIKQKIKDDEADLPPWAEKIHDAGKEQGEKEVQAGQPDPEQQEELVETKEALEIPVSEEESSFEEEPAAEIPKIELEKTPAFSSYNQGMLFGSEEEESGRREFGLFSFFKLSRQFKSRLFDVFLITVLWLISFGIAAYLTGNSVFSLIAGSVLPAAAFFMILIAVYFGLFLVFLRETLGDLLFSKEE
jgi:hypothetical protein